jgi:hypothetical protein
VPIEEIFPPKDRVSVAVHLRKGTGYDRPLRSVQIYNLQYPEDQKKKPGSVFFDEKFPMKFPPDQYFIDQIKSLYKLLKKTPLYVFVFTDDPNPHPLVERIQKEVGFSENEIVFDYRSGKTGHTEYVIDDLQSMKNFDILIRPESSTFTHIVDYILADFKIVIHPTGFHWAHDNLNRYFLYMDNICVDVRCPVEKIIEGKKRSE